jgi:hypothetical protein
MRLTAMELGRVEWRPFVLGSPGALRVGSAVRTTTGSALAIALAVVVTTLVTDRPIPHAGLLLILAIPIVAGGQLWAIATMLARRPSRRSGWRGRFSIAGSRNPRTFFFEGLPKRAANVLVAVFYGCWLTGVLTFLSLTSGGPASAGGACRYRLENHGTFKCVSHATYVHVGAAEQRFAAAVLAGFFVIHVGASAAELIRRRDHQP